MLPDPPAEYKVTPAIQRQRFLRSAVRGVRWGATGSTGQLVEHPLVKMLREHDVLVDRLAAAARKGHRGPAPSAVLKLSIGVSPAAKLRSVG